MSKVLNPGAAQAKKAAQAQRDALAKQKQAEGLRSAEEEDEVKRRQAIAKKGGNRSLLVATGETGLAKSLGGNV